MHYFIIQLTGTENMHLLYKSIRNQRLTDPFCFLGLELDALCLLLLPAPELVTVAVEPLAGGGDDSEHHHHAHVGFSLGHATEDDTRQASTRHVRRHRQATNRKIYGIRKVV